MGRRKLCPAVPGVKLFPRVKEGIADPVSYGSERGRSTFSPLPRAGDIAASLDLELSPIVLSPYLARVSEAAPVAKGSDAGRALDVRQSSVGTWHVSCR